MDTAVLCLLPHHAADGESVLPEVWQQDPEEGVRDPQQGWNAADSYFNAASPQQVTHCVLSYCYILKEGSGTKLSARNERF
jgi:hypothetical protein